MGKKALCVGINKFQNYPGAALQGCVNDALDMSALLREFKGFAEKEITVLTDGEATKANIMTKLRDMVASAEKEDLTSLVFSLSSHGTQIPQLEYSATMRG